MRFLIIAGGLAVLFGLSQRAEASGRQMPWLSLAPEVGYVFFGEGELEDHYHAKVPNRHGVVLKGHVDLGGDYGALELAPLYTWQHAAGRVGDIRGFGGEVSWVYRHPSGPLHPGIGIGFHGVFYAPNDHIQRGVDLMARIPIGMTYYFSRFLGFLMEVGPMLGATGIRFKADDDPVRYNLSEKIEYALVFGVDILVGLRFP